MSEERTCYAWLACDENVEQHCFIVVIHFVAVISEIELGRLSCNQTVERKLSRFNF